MPIPEPRMAISLIFLWCLSRSTRTSTGLSTTSRQNNEKCDSCRSARRFSSVCSECRAAGRNDHLFLTGLTERFCQESDAALWWGGRHSGRPVHRSGGHYLQGTCPVSARTGLADRGFVHG